MRDIGLGREHARTRGLMLIADMRIVDPTTGELLRHLTLDTNRDCQLGRTPGPQPKNEPEPNGFGQSGMS